MTPTQLQLRRDTNANWTSENPILANGEVGIETDATPIKFKIGNGTDAWVDLAYHTHAEFLLAINNLSDVSSPSSALTNLGLSSNGKSLVTAADYAAMKTLLGLVIGTNVEAHDADLTTIAGLTPSNDDVIQRKAGAWINRTISQLVTDIRAVIDSIYAPIAKGVTNGDTHDHVGGDGGTLAASSITNTPAGNISSTTVHAAINELDTAITDVPTVEEQGLAVGISSPTSADYLLWIKDSDGTLHRWDVSGLETFVDNIVVADLDSYLFFGTTIDCSANPNYPTASKGAIKVVTVAGKIGGSSGKVVAINDFIIAINNSAGGNEATVGTNWVVIPSKSNVLSVANNLSDITNPTTARANLAIDPAIDARLPTSIHGATNDTSPVDANEFAMVVSGVLHRLTWANLKAAVKVYLDAFYAATANGVSNGDSHDHVGGDGANITDAALSTSDITTNDATTSKHGFVVKATAPAANVLNVVGIGNGETVYANKAIFDGTNPADIGTATAGTSL